MTGAAVRYDNPMPELALSPSQGSMNSATEQYEDVPERSRSKREGKGGIIDASAQVGESVGLK
jgi:hypothetical protein